MFDRIMGFMTNPVNLASLMMGPAGWASMAARAMFSAVGQQVIQQLGNKMGLPQPMIDMAQAAFCQSCGDLRGAAKNTREAAAGLAEQFGLSPSQQGELQRSGDEFANKLTQMLVDRLREGTDEDSKAFANGGKAGGSLLMKIAVAMGKLLDKKMTDMANLTDDIGKLGTIDNKNSSKLGELTGKLQGLGQEVSMLSNAMTNTIKSIGEANSTIARKG